jgi:hypothetical protein
LALSQLNEWTDDELSQLIGTLDAVLPEVGIPEVAHCIELAVTAATGILYQRLELACRHNDALAVLAQYAD